MDSEQAKLLAVMLRTVDRHDLPVTRRQVEALAGDVAAWLASRTRPADDEDVVTPVVRLHGAVSRPGLPGGPTVEQLNHLVEKARSRALSSAEVERLSAGVAGLRLLADPRGPLELPCGRCGAGVGDVCRSAGRWWTQSHRERVVLWLAS